MKLNLKLLAATLLLTNAACLSTHAATKASNTYGAASVSLVTSIYVGDTFRANIDGWPPIVGERIPVRIKGIDTPELRGKCPKEKELARKAKQFTVQHLRSAKNIRLENIERGKYFRLLADVTVDRRSLGQLLIRSGHARPYDGGKKANWCN